MTTLPLIKSPKLKYNKELSNKIENLLQECDNLIDIPRLNQEMTQNFTSFNFELESLKKEKNQGLTESPRHAKKVEDYIKQKINLENSAKNSPNIESHSRNFSFDKETFTELSKNVKRKFGESLIDFSCVRDCESKIEKLPELQGKTFDVVTMKNKTKERNRSQKLGSLIKEYMGKRLGLNYSIDPGLKKEGKKIEQKKFKKITRPKLVMDTLKNEIEYLHPEFKSYLENTDRKLKLEKIMISLHQKNRKKYLFISN